MSVRETVARDIAEFAVLATRIKADWFADEAAWVPWFRGQKSARWPLVPALYRYSVPRRGLRIIEDEVRQEFIMRAPGLTDLRPQSSWEWYFLMQHAGTPTRLLDWTESALIALYFAVRDNEGTEDAAVWALDPWWLNKEVVGEHEVIPPAATIGLSEGDAKRYQAWLPDRYESGAKLPKLPVAVYPNYTAPRISTQRSCFTVHGSVPDGLGMARRPKDARLQKVIIPGANVRALRDQLLICGIDEVTIFPDIDGLGRSLTTTLKIETEFRKITYRRADVANEMRELLTFDRKIFHAYPGDLFDEKEWRGFDAYWMIVDGMTVGCSAFKANFDYDDSPKPGCLFIASTGIVPEMRGYGLGRRMKVWQIDYARKNGFKLVQTNMRQSNHAVISLNNRLGFKVTRVHRGYYPTPPEAAVVMELRLVESGGMKVES